MGPYISLLCAALLAVSLPAAPAHAGAPPEPAEAKAADIAEEPEGGAGVSPIELVPRVELRQSFQQLENGVSIHDTTLEIDIQFLRRLLLRYQVPHRILQTPAGQTSGFGDVQLGALVIITSTPTTLVAAIAGAVLDTASQPPLGAGKQQVFFGGGAAFKPRRWVLTYGVLQEQVSVGGNSARPDVNELTLDLGAILFGKQYNWLKGDLVPTFDFAGSTGARCFGVLEVGSLVVGRVGLFVRAGTQLAGPSQLDYSLAAGLRYLFRLEQGKPKSATEGSVTTL